MIKSKLTTNKSSPVTSNMERESRDLRTSYKVTSFQETSSKFSSSYSSQDTRSLKTSSMKASRQEIELYDQQA